MAATFRETRLQGDRMMDQGLDQIKERAVTTPLKCMWTKQGGGGVWLPWCEDRPRYEEHVGDLGRTLVPGYTIEGLLDVALDPALDVESGVFPLSTGRLRFSAVNIQVYDQGRHLHVRTGLATGPRGLIPRAAAVATGRHDIRGHFEGRGSDQFAKEVNRDMRRLGQAQTLVGTRYVCRPHDLGLWGVRGSGPLLEDMFGDVIQAADGNWTEVIAAPYVRRCLWPEGIIEAWKAGLVTFPVATPGTLVVDPEVSERLHIAFESREGVQEGLLALYVRQVRPRPSAAFLVALKRSGEDLVFGRSRQEWEALGMWDEAQCVDAEGWAGFKAKAERRGEGEVRYVKFCGPGAGECLVGGKSEQGLAQGLCAGGVRA